MLIHRLRSVDPALAAIVAEGFLSRLSFGLISFALPLYAYQEFGLTLTQIGVLLSLNLAVAILLKPLAGSLADRVGMRPTLTAAIGLRSLVSLLLAVVAAPWQLFAVRGVHGVSIALRDPPASVLLAERGGKHAVASAFAWYQTAKSVAGALGKAAAGVLLALGSASFTLVFLCAFVLSALPVLVVLRYVREAEDVAEELPRDLAAEPAELGSTEERPAAGGRPRVVSYMGVGFLISSTAYMLANLFPVFAVEYAGLTTAQTGLIYLIAPAVVLTGPVFGWLSDNVSRKLVLSVRSAANVGSSLVYLVAPSFAGVAVGRVVDDMGKAAFRPAWGAMMAEVAGFDRRTRARTMGSMSAGEDAGEIAGPILAGFLWSTWGVPVLLGVRIALAVVTEIVTLVVTGSLGRAPPRRTRREARRDHLALSDRPPVRDRAARHESSAMLLTPVEIQHQPLKGRGRRYDREEVDKLLERAAASYEQIWLERDRLGARVTELEGELGSFRNSEGFLRESLVTAHRVANEVRTEARQEAARLARQALDKRKRARAAAERELEELRAEIERLRSLERDLCSNLRSLFHAGLSLIEDEGPVEQAPPSQSLPNVLRAEPSRTEHRYG